MNLQVQTIDDATWCPRSISASTRCEPMNPAPPITITRKEGSPWPHARGTMKSVCNRPESPFQKIAEWKRIARAERNGRRVEPRKDYFPAALLAPSSPRPRRLTSIPRRLIF